jgi:hypothetical protein
MLYPERAPMGLNFLSKNEFDCQRWLIGCFIWVTFFNKWVGDSAGNTAAFVAATLFGASLVATRVVVQGIPSLSVAVLRFGQGELILFLCPSCPYHGCNLDSLFQDEVCDWVPLLIPLIRVWNLVPIKTHKICMLQSEIWSDLISWLEILIFLSDLHFS